MDAQLRFAIIGCGRIAERHAIELMRHGQLYAVCDIIPEKADALAQKTGAKAYYSLADLLAEEKGTGIISICTPNGIHAEQSIQCMQAGHHVLCEKPMALSSEDARKMIETADKTGQQLFVVKQNRFNPPVAFVKQLLDENRMGALLSFQLNCFWNRPPRLLPAWLARHQQVRRGHSFYTIQSFYRPALLAAWGCGFGQRHPFQLPAPGPYRV